MRSEDLWCIVMREICSTSNALLNTDLCICCYFWFPIKIKVYVLMYFLKNPLNLSLLHHGEDRHKKAGIQIYWFKSRLTLIDYLGLICYAVFLTFCCLNRTGCIRYSDAYNETWIKWHWGILEYGNMYTVWSDRLWKYKKRIRH